MSLLDAVRAGVVVAHGITLPLQTEVSFERCISADVEGAREFEAPVFLPAAVAWKRVSMQTPTGIVSVTRPVLTFLDVALLKLATEEKGISENDRITLPDGTTGPTRNLGGFLDAGTMQPFATEVVIG